MCEGGPAEWLRAQSCLCCDIGFFPFWLQCIKYLLTRVSRMGTPSVCTYLFLSPAYWKFGIFDLLSVQCYFTSFLTLHMSHERVLSCTCPALAPSVSLQALAVTVPVSVQWSFVIWVLSVINPGEFVWESSYQCLFGCFDKLHQKWAGQDVRLSSNVSDQAECRGELRSMSTTGKYWPKFQFGSSPWSTEIFNTTQKSVALMFCQNVKKELCW